MRYVYEIDEQTALIIVELLKKASELGLDNVNFSYDEVDFSLSQFKTFWQLSIKQAKAEGVAVYRVFDGVIKKE